MPSDAHEPESPRLIRREDLAQAAYAGGTWIAFEGEAPPEAPWENEIDTSPITAEEMTGIWLTTVWGQESPVWLDGQPVEPEELGIPAEIADRLRDWADMWNTQWNPDSGWEPRARITDYEALGEWLARRVKDACGPVRVSLQPAHLGRSGVRTIDGPEQREPVVLRLMNDYGARMPVRGPGGRPDEFVTEFGVGSFSSEINARLEAWAQEFAAFMDPRTGWSAPELAAGHAQEGADLVHAMQAELGPDYRVELVLWELGEDAPARPDRLGEPAPAEP